MPLESTQQCAVFSVKGGIRKKERKKEVDMREKNKWMKRIRKDKEEKWELMRRMVCKAVYLKYKSVLASDQTDCFVVESIHKL